MSDVAIVGAGIHPFGRHPGVTGLEMAATAARSALADAGLGWEDIDFAAGGSDSAGNADTSVSVLGLTGLPFINVKNGCATGGTALTTAHAMLASGAAEVALVVGFDKHPPGAFNPLPGGVGHRLLVRRDRPDADHPVLRDEDPALHGRARHQHLDARQGRVEGVQQRRAQPKRLAAQAAVRGRGAGVEDGQPPADAVHVLLAGRGRGRAGACARRASRRSRPNARVAALGRLPHAPLRLLRGLQPVDPGRVGAVSDRRGRRRGVRGGRHRPRGRRRRAGAGHRVRRRGHAPRRDRPVRARRAGGADPERRDRDRRPPAGQHRRRLPRQRRADRRVGPAAGARGGRCSCAARPATARSRAAACRLHAGVRRARASAPAPCSAADTRRRLGGACR